MEQLKKAGAAATEADLRSLLVESLEAGRSMQIELAAAMASTAEQATRIAVLEAEKGHTVHRGSEMTARRALTVDMDHAALQRQQYHQVRLRQTLSAMFPAPPEARDLWPTFFWHRLYAIFHLPHSPLHRELFPSREFRLRFFHAGTGKGRQLAIFRPEKGC